MKKKVFLIGTCMVLILTGCGADTPPAAPSQTTQPTQTVKPTETEAAEPKAYTSTSDIYTIHPKTPTSYEAEVVEYNLGSGEYKTQAGKTMPYKLRGVIGVPKGEGPFPLVLLTHGSHSNEDESLRFDTGFTYLVEHLAQNGYIAVSMDMSSAYLWKFGENDDKEKSIHIADGHIQNLKEASSGTEKTFPMNLQSKIDFSQIGLIGLSRGGDTVFDIALDQQAKGLSIHAILSVAPILPADAETKDWPDTMTSIIVPEYDGDVVSLDGFGIYTMLEEKISAMHAVTFLRRANHNYFNTNLTTNDALLARSEEQLTDQITAKEQQNFLSHYAVDFFQAAFAGNTEDTIYTADKPMPNQMYGLDVMVRTGGEADTSLLPGASSSLWKAEGCDISSVQDSWFYEADKAVIDTVTFGNGVHQVRDLLNIKWQQSGAKASFVPSDTDFEKHTALSVRLVTDPSDTLNDNIDCQAFTVMLTDEKGNTSAITLPAGLNSLSKTPGFLDMTPIFDMEVHFWSSPSPILNTTIPLSEFKDVDLKNIVSVTLQFNQTGSGSLFLEDILLQ